MLTTEQHQKISTLLKKKKLIELVNAHLEENGIEGIIVKSINFAQKPDEGLASRHCPPDHEPREICTIEGRCEIKCVPK
jgi:hypothetical protein